MAVNLEIYLVLNTFLCRLAVYANNVGEMKEEKKKSPKTRSECKRKKGARAILEMTDEVWRGV
jgi:hypothetical protein